MDTHQLKQRIDTSGKNSPLFLPIRKHKITHQDSLIDNFHAEV